jgi:YggT family protein
VGLIGLFASVVFVALVLFIATMWVRLILDWVRALRPAWRPSGPLLVIAEACFAVTDPPVRLVRRVVKPVRFAGGVLDFAWSIVLVGALVLLYLVGPLRD